MGDLRIINAFLTTFNENMQILTRWTGFSRKFMEKSTPPADIDYVGIREMMFQFRLFEMRCESMESAAEMVASTKEQLKTLNYADAEGIQMKFDTICNELKIIKCVRMEMRTKLEEHCSILKKVYDMHKEIAAHVVKFQQIIKAIYNGDQHLELYKKHKKEEINKLLGKHKELWFEQNRAKQEMDAIKILEQKIEELLQSAQLSKVENSHTNYTAEEMDKDWQKLVTLKIKKGDEVRRQWELYKEGDAFCKKFGDNMKSLYESVSAEVQHIDDVVANGDRAGIVRIIEDVNFRNFAESELAGLVETKKLVDDWSIVENLYITVIAQLLVAKIGEYTDKLERLAQFAEETEADNEYEE